MPLFFGKPTEQVKLTPRAELERKYEGGRSNLLFAIILTAVNIVAPLFGANIYMLFSIFVPTLLVTEGRFICGLYPEEVYEELDMSGIVLLDKAYFFIFLIIAVVITLVFLLMWLLSKNGKVGFMIAATVLFALDTLAIFFLAGGITFDIIFDILFHAWVMYYLIVAIVAHFKLKSLPAEEENGDAYDSVLDAFANPDPNNFK